MGHGSDGGAPPSRAGVRSDLPPSAEPTADVRSGPALRLHLSTRDAEGLAAEDLDEAIRDAGKPTNAALGAACGADESQVRRWRDRGSHGRPWTAARLYQLPPDIFEAFVLRARATRERLQRDAALPLETLAPPLALEGNDLVRIVLQALRDGKVSDEEREEIARAAARVGAAAAPFMGGGGNA